ncbi:KAP family P-loop NTPase fold protein [Amycolatopsis balhimycina]|nr:P-loop NTPase fold protein [Amycolatopsis balhimycina]
MNDAQKVEAKAAAPPQETSQGPVTVPDRPITCATEDRLGFAAYAGVFTAYFLHHDTPTPLTLAVSGPWGSGKTSLAWLIDERLKVTENWRGRWFEEPLTCRFNAWHHADAPNIGVALAAHVGRLLGPERHLWLRALQPLPTTMLSPSRRWWRRIWQGMAGVFLALAGLMALVWLFPALHDKMGPIGAVPAHATNPVVLAAAGSALLALATRAYKAAGLLGSYLETPQALAAKGSIAEVRAHLGVLVRQALRQRPGGKATRRLVIFIDDLERCPGDKALGLCEVVSQLLDHPGVIVVLISDLAPLAAAAATRYQEADTGVPAAVLGQRYLDKLINMRFNLPPLSTASVRRLFDNEPTVGGP